MNKIKLLIITDEMEIGGSQRQIVNILLNLDQSKYDLNLLYFRHNSILVDQLKRNGVNVININKRGKLDLIFIWKLVRLFKQGRFDVVHAFSFTGELWGALAHYLSFGTGVFLSSVRGTYEWYNSIQWYLKKRVTLHSKYVISNAKLAGNFAFEQMKLGSSRLKIIHNGISIDNTFISEESDLSGKFNNYSWRICFIGRLVDHKNVACLLRSVKLVNSHTDDDIGVFIVGDGPDRLALEQLKDELQLKNVHFLGEISNTSYIYTKSNVTVLPSFREGMSNTILESMCHGTPVIASNVGGSPEIIKDGVNGLLFSSDNEHELAERILNLYNNTSLADDVAKSAKYDCETQFSTQIMVDNFDNLYTSVVNDERNL